jgi:hypothetical protein
MTSGFGPADPAERRRFWIVLVGGWVAYATLTYLTILPSLDPGEWLPMIGIKLLRSALGLLATLLLFRLYRRLSFRLPQVVVVGVVACGLLGIAWLLLMNLAVAPLRPSGIPMVNWRTLPRQGLDYGVVLVAWSAILVTVPAGVRPGRPHRRSLRPSRWRTANGCSSGKVTAWRSCR